MSFVLSKNVAKIFERNTTINFLNIRNISNDTFRRFHQGSTMRLFRCNKGTSLLENVRLTKTDIRTIYAMPQNTFMASKDETRELMAIWPDIVRDLTDAGNLEIPEVSKWLAKVLQYNVPVGRKNRALSAIYAYKSFAPQDQQTEENIRLARILAWCTEMLQGFLLVFDDIQDQSTVRRNQPCWHLHSGSGVAATNDCLLMEMCIYELFRKHLKSKDCYTEIMELFLNTTYKTAIGQCIDLQPMCYGTKKNFEQFTMNRYNSLIKYKTSYYTFVLPVVSAMLLAGIKDPEVYRQSKTILLEIGHLFQVRDDYMDCYADIEVTKKIGNDIAEGKCTWLAVVALQRATKEQRKIFEECYGKPEPEHVNRIKDLYNDLGVSNTYAIYEEETHNLLHTHIQQASRLPHEFFLNLLERGCPRVGRKD